MKPALKYLLGGLAALVLGALLFLSYRFILDNEIGRVNALKRKAKKEYFAHEFVSASLTYQLLMDSLHAQDGEVGINHANATFLSYYSLHHKGYRGSMGNTNNAPVDSVQQQLYDRSLDAYSRLTVASKNNIASIAENQTGFAILKGDEIKKESATDSLLTASLVHFKNALVKDPSNDSARYNYELVKKLVLFPETILSQTKVLVAQQKYTEAANLLEGAMKRDRRLKQQQELLKKIKIIIGIDSLKTRKI